MHAQQRRQTLSACCRCCCNQARAAELARPFPALFCALAGLDIAATAVSALMLQQQTPVRPPAVAAVAHGDGPAALTAPYALASACCLPGAASLAGQLLLSCPRQRQRQAVQRGDARSTLLRGCSSLALFPEPSRQGWLALLARLQHQEDELRGATQRLQQLGAGTSAWQAPRWVARRAAGLPTDVAYRSR